MIAEYPQAGKWCWAKDCAGYGLPEGLPDRSRVKVIEEMMPHFVVENEHGRRWKLYLAQLDAGFTYWLDGEPYFETHPKAIHYLRHYLFELEKWTPIATDAEATRNERRSHVRWKLERNGFDPDGPLPPGPPPRFTGSPRRISTHSPRAPQQPQEAPQTPRRMNS